MAIGSDAVISKDDGGFELVLRREIRPEEMDKCSVPVTASGGSSGQAPGGSGDEASDGV